MEENLNENDIKERFYSTLYKADETLNNITTSCKGVNLIKNTPRRPPIRRYWHTNGDQTVSKVNPVRESNQFIKKTQVTDESKSKGQKLNSSLPPSQSVDLSSIQSPVPQFVSKTIEIVKNDAQIDVVELDSSDEDDVVEVRLPPQRTITIDSSDDEISEVSKNTELNKKTNNIIVTNNKTPTNRVDREVSASPVPSIVSSVSDDFIRGDCIALNISSKRPNNQSFDFSLHGSDIIDQSSPPKRKKKKQSKDNVTSTPITNTSVTITPPAKEGDYFATPKSKAKNKRQKAKKYPLSEKSIPNADLYDSDSNLSIIDVDSSQRSYLVTDKSFPNTDVYESDSNQSGKTNPSKANQHVSENVCTTSDNSIYLDFVDKDILMSMKQNNSTGVESSLIVNLTESTLTDTISEENIVMANVTGFPEPEDEEGREIIIDTEATKYGSTNVPAILYEDLDFDNLKGKEKVCKKRRYSLSTLRAEMEKFYNESWGGENFNHREIQKNMSRDKNLWVIDPKDRMPGLSRRKPTCHYCNRSGHREESCRMKPAVCYMCGLTGHYEPRCPRKICVNCGSPSNMYTSMCRTCCNWNSIKCFECGQNGHPSSHCPDLWRRYHNTITCTTELEENHQIKKHYQMFCSGCARRGHLVHTCRLSLPFSGLPINSPYVSLYRPIYFATNKDNDKVEDTPQRNQQFCRVNTQDSTISSATTPTNKNNRKKRRSNSPISFETHMNKKRNISNTDEVIDDDTQRNTKSPIANPSGRKTPQNKIEVSNKPVKDAFNVINNNTEPPKTNNDIEKVSDCILTSSTNHDKKGQIIQDNEVSDTNDLVSSARVYITREIGEKLKTKEGEEWLKKSMLKHNVTMQNMYFDAFLSILGKVGDQAAFHADFRDWIKSKEGNGEVKANNDLEREEVENNDEMCNNIPSNRHNVLRKINKALESLKQDLGDPKDLYNKLTYLQNCREKLLKQQKINPKQLSNNRKNIDGTLKKLNMVLLGQAGLANGASHLNKLYSLQEKLSNYRQKYVPLQLRREIGEHYHSIFTPFPRRDYQELLSIYHTTRAKIMSLRKNKGVKSPKLVNKRLVKIWHKKKIDKEETGGQQIVTGSTNVGKHLLQHSINTLMYYQRRLENANPCDKILNIARVDLMNRLNSHIDSLGQNNTISLKYFKKMRKRMKITQQQAQFYLTNV